MEMQIESSTDLSIDDFYFSALIDESEDQILPVSDSKYAEELQFQETLMSSLIASKSHPPIQTAPNPNPPDPIDHQTTIETGQSSLSFCEICVERKETDQMFKTEGCVHSFCADCISKHVATKIEDSITIVTCPEAECQTVLELDTCRPMLPREVVDVWERTICEGLVPESEKFYCPYKDCSAMMVVDSGEGAEEIRESECPVCHRLFCARCYVTWHAGVGCEEYQKMNEDEKGREDLMVRELANQKKWGRCPNCKFYVERTEGCPHITCRCKFQFCYGCGSAWTQSHGGCQRN